jgi:ParB family chromosome partitioning protein
LPSELHEKIEKGEITSSEAIHIARKPKSTQYKLATAATAGKLQEEMAKAGVKRGAPRGLHTIRLVFNPRKRSDKQIWERLNEKATQKGLEVSDYVRNILVKYV